MKYTDQPKPNHADEFGRLLKVGILRQLYIEKRIEEPVYRELSAAFIQHHRPEKKCK